MNIRPTKSEDIPALKNVLDGTELFPSEMLADMTSGFLSDPENGEIWLTCEVDGDVIGFCFAIPEEMTDGTWNLLAIAVLPSKQGSGAGGALVTQLEAVLSRCQGRLLIVDTSGTDDFKQTRAFYRKNGYTEEARIRDFWANGEDKIVFRKALNRT